MLHIKALIAEKRQQIRLLEGHIEQLEAMAAQTVGMILPRWRERTDTRPAVGISTGTIGRVRAYLAEHPGFQRVKNIADALGVRATSISGQITDCVEKGEMVRGERGYVKLAEHPPEPKPIDRPKKGTKSVKVAKPGNGVDQSRAAHILAYLAKHPNGVTSKDARQTLRMSSDNFWASLTTALRDGRVVRPKPGILALKK